MIILKKKFIEQKELLVDGGIAILLAAVLGLASLVASGTLDTVIFGMLGRDFWFQADIERVHYNMIDVASDHFRTNVHPLFSLMGYFSTQAVHKIFNLSLETHLAHAVRGVIALIASLWMASFYVLLRLLSLKRIDAILFAVLAGVSSSSLCSGFLFRRHFLLALWQSCQHLLLQLLPSIEMLRRVGLLRQELRPWEPR